MTELYGRSRTKEELLRRVGSMDQVAGVRRLTLAGGTEKGVAAIEFRTGTGLSFCVLPDRGMDISRADYGGMALAWCSGTGDAAPSFFEPEGLGWLRTFYGGLVVTCGLSYAGAPGPDGDEELGLHGRVSHIPATNVAADAEWRDDEYVMYARGKVRETSVFGANLLMTRTITAKLGESRLSIHDVVENQAFRPQEHMIVYHCNFGFPLLDEGTRLVGPSRQVTPRDDHAKAGLDEHAEYPAPISGFEEQVYYHEMAADGEGDVLVGLVNPRCCEGPGMGVYLKYPLAQLPRFAQWKMPGEGTYVTGLEPANCWVAGRAAERERGTLRVLEPGERQAYRLEIGVLWGQEALEEFERKVRALA